jgi:hypothetical protein
LGGVGLLRLEHGVGKHRVQFLADAQLLLLESAEGGNHERVLEVARDQALKHLHVATAELTHALLEQTTHDTVGGALTVLHSNHI